MLFKEIRLTNIRNIPSAVLQLRSKLNVVIGENGAGKTSLLEGISVLANGRSFRTSKIPKVITRDSANLTVFAEANQLDQTFRLGLLRDSQGSFQAKINGQKCNTLSEISKILPVITIAPGYYDNILTQRKERSKLFDWGLFHVEHSFHHYWLQYGKILKQRNALLKKIKDARFTDKAQEPGLIKHLSHWDSLLVDAAKPITEQRKNYVAQMNEMLSDFQPFLTSLQETISLVYRDGWSSKKSLKEHIESGRERDIQLGYTRSGPHRSDIDILLGNEQAVEIASRGQQKLIVSTLVLSIIKKFISTTQKHCFIAIDDLPAELDSVNQATLIRLLMSMKNVQILLTAISLDSLKEAISGYNSLMFHVEHGQFSQMSLE
ncbi:DNA replication/repair protein RecF [Pleionea sp. CnH1-48]|uniref:DNA replication/repair protein RecF n=1 Tax=Pleionea sp. CnH1-48 TaxID=2954494 RepID=UPI00209860B0|nr:DNA replication/repair protein RecF [Pleionea sp. CnH1-48]MCO7226624.1 DNA replication/repair protein RecF [Pleionea sp. CnH1-48]